MNFRRRQAVAALLAVVLLLSSEAQRAAAEPTPGCDSPEQCLAAIASTRGDIRGMSGSFTQTKTIALLREPLVSTGKFALTRPDGFRWEVLSPEPFVLESEGGKVRAGPPGKLQEVRDVPATALSEMGGVLAGDASAVGKRFTVKSGDGPGSFVLEPRDPGLARMVASIELVLDVKTGTPRRVTLREAGGDSSQIEFQDVVLERDPSGGKAK